MTKPPIDSRPPSRDSAPSAGATAHIDSQKAEQAGGPRERGGARPKGAPPWGTDVNDRYQVREDLATALE